MTYNMEEGSEYEYFVESYEARHKTGKDLGFMAEYPQMISLVKPLRKRELLDLGSGLGHHAAYYRKKGAIVTVLDKEQKMLDTISQKTNKVCHDMNKKLPFSTESFDIITASLVLDHIKKIKKVFKECHRILKQDGDMYFSIPNPLFTQEKPIAGFIQNADDIDIFGNYFRKRKIINEYEGHTITLYHRPLQNYYDAFLEAGFRLEKFIEARPKKLKDPIANAFMSRNPYFLLFKLRKN